MPARFLVPLATHCPFGSFQFAGLGHLSESWPSAAPALASLAYIDWPVTVVVGLPVVGLFYYDVEGLRTSFSESLRVCLGDQPISF